MKYLNYKITVKYIFGVEIIIRVGFILIFII
jgi:hypothetical protein